MSRLVKTHIFCDNCKNEIEEDMVSSFEIRYEKKTYHLDLCPACENKFTGMWITTTVPAPKKDKPGPPAKKMPTKAQYAKYLPCPECDRKFETAHGLQVHVARSHKK